MKIYKQATCKSSSTIRHVTLLTQYSIAVATLVFLRGDTLVHGFGISNVPRSPTKSPRKATNTATTNADPSTFVDLLVIGAGPTGLTAAAEAKRMGMTVRIVDRKNERSTHDSRALVVHPRVMELLNGMGDGRVTDRLIERGYKLGALNFHPGTSTEPVKVQMDSGIFGDTSFPFMTWLPQYYTESTLQEELERMGGNVEWGKSIKSIAQDDETVETALEITSDGGSIETIVSRYVVGCDGGRSKTRELLDIQMERAGSKFYFVFADITFEKPIQYNADEVCAFFHPEGVALLFPLPTPLTYRLGALAPPGITDKTDPSVLDDTFLNGILRRRTTVTEPCETGRFSKVFEITHGIADTYRQGRAFLAGDSAHVHSPVGGQGMNYGITDAVNLVWKLAWVERCRHAGVSSPTVDGILESYDIERRSIGKRLLANTERGTFIVASDNIILQKIRNLIVSVLLPRIFPKRVRALGQLTLPCSGSPSPVLCDDDGTYLCGSGDRLPNIRLIVQGGNGDEGKQRLHASIDRLRHTWVVLNPGDDGAADVAAAGSTEVIRAVPSENQDTLPSISASALKRRQVILVRPDLFVAGVGESIKDVKDSMENRLDRDVVAHM